MPPARDKLRMAAKKKAANTRREPSFDDDDDDSPELSVTGSDRASPTSDRASSAKPRKRRARKKRPTRGIGARIGRIAYWGLVAGLWLGIACVGVIAWTGAHLPPIQSLEIPKRPPSIQIVDMQGRALARRGDLAGAPLPLREMPGYVPKAFIAIEDRRFYDHYGVDPYGIGRAFVANVLHRSVAQGGSTITQQLAKNLFLTQERTINRKLQEGLLALWLERKFSKTQILEMYLNRVYFGSGAYGIEQASQHYFGKSARNISLAEAAMLAGVVKSPSRLAPTRNFSAAERRAKSVLAAMADLNFINRSAERMALARPPRIVAQVNNGSVNYVADWVMDALNDAIGHVDEDIVVQTTIDANLQMVAEKALEEELAQKGDKNGVGQGAVIAMTPDGSVRALVGGRSYADSQFNRAVAAKRQPGSAFKAFVYLTALEHGLTPDTVREDKPINVKGWQPENYNKGPRRAPGKLQPRALRPVYAEPGAGAIAEYGLRAVDARGHADGRGPHGVSSGHRLETRAERIDRARHLGGLDARTRRRLCVLRQWRLRAGAARDRQDHRDQRQGHVRAQRSAARPHHRGALRSDDERDDDRNAHLWHRATCELARLARRRKDRHQPGFPRCLVYRLHCAPRDRRMARQRRRNADQTCDRRKSPGGNLEPRDAHRAPGRAGCKPARYYGRHHILRILRRRRAADAAGADPAGRSERRIDHRQWWPRQLVPQYAVRPALISVLGARASNTLRRKPQQQRGAAHRCHGHRERPGTSPEQRTHDGAT